MKMKPLLVNYNGHYNTKMGIRNLSYLRSLMGADFMQCTVSPSRVKKITLETLKILGSMYWHILAGQTVYPVRTAVQFKIPLIIWGAHQGIDQVGMYSHLDEVEMTRKYRKEHDLMGFEAEVPPDRVEVGTLMIAGMITKGNIKICRCLPEDLSSVIDCLSLVGAKISTGSDWIEIQSKDLLTSLDVETSPFPGFPTDLQAQFMSLMCIAKGDCRITETIFENRFMHVAELNRMGGKIVLSGRDAKISGVSNLNGAPVNATDLRASASLVLAGLAARGETVIDSVFHLDRGYETLEVGLRSLGAKIERIDS